MNSALPQWPERGADLTSAADIQQRAAGVAGLLAGQPQDGFGHFLSFAASAHGYAGLDSFDAPRLAAAGMDLGADHAWPHGIDPNAFGGNFLGQAERHAVDRALGGGVVDVFVGRAEFRCDRGNIDDGTALAAI